MPRAKLTQTTGWCLKTRSARMITQQARVIDPLMAQCWSSFYDAGTTLIYQCSNASCLLGTQGKGCFFHNYFILPHLAFYITVCDD